MEGSQTRGDRTLAEAIKLPTNSAKYTLVYTDHYKKKLKGVGRDNILVLTMAIHYKNVLTFVFLFFRLADRVVHILLSDAAHTLQEHRAIPDLLSQHQHVYLREPLNPQCQHVIDDVTSSHRD